MQLPPDDEIVMVSGHPPVRAQKIRFYADPNFKGRQLAAPTLSTDGYADRPEARGDDWSGVFDKVAAEAARRAAAAMDEDEGGLRLQPELDITVPQAAPVEEEPHREVGSLLDDDDDADREVERVRAIRAARSQGAQRLARNAALDPDDGIAL